MLKAILLNFIGWMFILLGILGIILPILPGFIFLFLGLTILSSSNHWSKKVLQFIRRKFPRIAQKSDQILRKLRILK